MWISMSYWKTVELHGIEEWAKLTGWSNSVLVLVVLWHLLTKRKIQNIAGLIISDSGHFENRLLQGNWVFMTLKVTFHLKITKDPITFLSFYNLDATLMNFHWPKAFVEGSYWQCPPKLHDINKLQIINYINTNVGCCDNCTCPVSNWL